MPGMVKCFEEEEEVEDNEGRETTKRKWTYELGVGFDRETLLPPPVPNLALQVLSMMPPGSPKRLSAVE